MITSFSTNGNTDELWSSTIIINPVWKSWIDFDDVSIMY